MNFKAHLILGSCVALSSYYYRHELALSQEEMILSASLILSGSIFPDIDTQSIPSRMFAVIGAMISLVCISLKRFDISAYLGLFFMICKMGKHRGWTHKYWIPLLLVLSSLLLDFYRIPLMAISVGLICHYLADQIGRGGKETGFEVKCLNLKVYLWLTICISKRVINEDLPYKERIIMMTSLFSSATGMSAQQRQIDTIANNLANVNTTGFKQDRNHFQDLLYSHERLAGSSSSQTTKNPNGIHLGHGVKHVSSEKIFTQGNLKHTGNELDLSIDGDGFFQVLRPDGSFAYSRNGSWKKDAEGRVVNDDGYFLEPEVVIPPEAQKIMIGEDGTIEVLLGNDRTPTPLGKIQLAKFVNPSGLTPIGKSLYIETSASGAPIVGEPAQNGMGYLSQGFIEASNVSVVDEMVNMITAQRAYEVNSKAIQTSDNMLQTAVNIIR